MKKGWVNLGELIGRVKTDTLIGKKVRVVAETDGWCGVSEGDEGTLLSVGWAGKATADLDTYPHTSGWGGQYACFEVLMSDEEDIL
jgi:hypothetical protein